jgi:hypothetical protein
MIMCSDVRLLMLIAKGSKANANNSVSVLPVSEQTGSVYIVYWSSNSVTYCFLFVS